MCFPGSVVGVVAGREMERYCSTFERQVFLSRKELPSMSLFFEDDQSLPEDNPIGGGSEPGAA
jgi:hypothetical protein